MIRGPYPKAQAKNEDILRRAKELKSEHPFWGYRRIWAHLKFVDKLPVNKKRIERLMRQNDLQVKPNLRLKAKRTPSRSKPRATAPNQWWGIDMTKVLVPSFGWIYIVVVLDWYTKKIVGYYAGLQCKSVHWLAALNMAVNRQFPDGAREHAVHLMADNGCQPTSRLFMEACSTMAVHQAFTSYSNPKGNADTERMMRTLKEELFWLREWDSPFVLAKGLESWIERYNESYLHSSLGYKSPRQFQIEYQTSHITQFQPA